MRVQVQLQSTNTSTCAAGEDISTKQGAEKTLLVREKGLIMALKDLLAREKGLIEVGKNILASERGLIEAREKVDKSRAG